MQNVAAVPCEIRKGKVACHQSNNAFGTGTRNSEQSSEGMITNLSIFTSLHSAERTSDKSQNTA